MPVRHLLGPQGLSGATCKEGIPVCALLSGYWVHNEMLDSTDILCKE